MKNIFLVFSILFTNLLFSQVPDLAKKTLTGQLTIFDFENQKTYMVNIDTLQWSKEVLSGDLTYYSNKDEMVKRLNLVFQKMDSKKITHFAEINESPFILPRKKQWVMLIDNYRIDWWFSINDSTKLETITLVKY
jgi:hypothetical protein